MKSTRVLAWIACLMVAAPGCKDDAAKPPPAAQPDKRVVPAAESAAAGSAAAGSETARSAAVDGIRLPHVPPKVGDKRTEVEHLTMSMHIEAAPGKQVAMGTVKHSEETQEVIAVEGDVITKLKVSYGARTEQQTTAGKTKDKPSPLAGKTYVVWRDGEQLQATREDGSAPPSVELTAVLKANRRVGRPAAMEQILGGRLWKLGERVELSADQLKQIADARGPDSDQPVPSAMSLTLASTDGSTAVFATTMTLVGKTADGWMETAITGTLTGDLKSGNQRAMQLAGPFKGEMGKPLTGTMEITTTYTY